MQNSFICTPILSHVSRQCTDQYIITFFYQLKPLLNQFSPIEVLLQVRCGQDRNKTLQIKRYKIGQQMK